MSIVLIIQKKIYFCIMKFVSAIMVILVIGLSLVPCCPPETTCFQTSNYDNDEHCESDEHCNDQESENDHCDVCSPFFTCGSCTGVPFPNFNCYESLEIISSNSFKFPFSESFLSFYIHKMWQPPKI